MQILRALTPSGQLIVDFDRRSVRYGRYEIFLRSILLTALVAWAGWLLLLLFGPLLVPVRPLDETLHPHELADPDSRFIDVDGLDVHYKEEGEGEPVFLLLHGFGASLFSWRLTIDPLARAGRVVAYDRPGFGLTERPIVSRMTDNPYTLPAQGRLVDSLLNQLGAEQAILVGNSMGGTVALQAALNFPHRVSALILVDPAIYLSDLIPGWLQSLLPILPASRLGPLLSRYLIRFRIGDQLLFRSWHEPLLITPEIHHGYTKPLRAENWDYALWYTVQYHAGQGLHLRLHEISIPTLIVTGDSDRVIPSRQSLRLARYIEHAELAVIPECGHLPHEEKPEEFLSIVSDFLIRNKLIDSQITLKSVQPKSSASLVPLDQNSG